MNEVVKQFLEKRSEAENASSFDVYCLQLAREHKDSQHDRSLESVWYSIRACLWVSKETRDAAEEAFRNMPGTTPRLFAKFVKTCQTHMWLAWRTGIFQVGRQG